MLLAVRDLTKRYGGLPALDGVDLDVEAGEIVAVIGPNGAGKSTLLGLIAGLVPPSAGTVRLAGHTLTGRAPHEIRRLGVATVRQTADAFASMSVADNVFVGARFGGAGGRLPVNRARAAAAEALDLVGLTDVADRAVATLPLHARRTVDLARALAGRPRLLLLDEVMAGLTDAEIAAHLEVIARGRDALGAGVVWVEHVMDAVSALAERVVALHLGAVLAAGRADEVLTHPAVVDAYLGDEGAC